MLSNKKGDLNWDVVIVGIIVVIVIIGFAFLYITFSGGIKEGGNKLFNKANDYKELADKFFSDEEKGLSLSQRIDYVEDLILSNFSVSGDNCLGKLNIGDEEKIKGLSVYFVKNNKGGTDFYIFEGDSWRDNFDVAILNNKYIKKGFFSGNAYFVYNGNEINEFLLHNNLEYITFTSGKVITKKITGFTETLDITGMKESELYDKITQNQIRTSNYKIIHPIFLKNSNKIQILDIAQLLKIYQNTPPCNGVFDIIMPAVSLG